MLDDVEEPAKCVQEDQNEAYLDLDITGETETD